MIKSNILMRVATLRKTQNKNSLTKIGIRHLKEREAAKKCLIAPLRLSQMKKDALSAALFLSIKYQVISTLVAITIQRHFKD